VNVFTALLDTIYPPRCPLCGRFLHGRRGARDGKTPFFCPDCLEGFKAIGSPRCSLCGRPFPPHPGEDHSCEACLRNPPLFEAATGPYVYEGPLMEAIHLFKYGKKASLARPLGLLLARYGERQFKGKGDMVIMPVPLHPRRLRERGFNQSLLLARHVAGRLESDLDFLSLRRVRYTLPQTGLGKEARKMNVRRAFEVRGCGTIQGRAVLLVDDVATTGNTLNECARVLKKAGATTVRCLVLAQTMGP